MTPYLNPAQITSGTLAYSFGCGKAIVSTPYWHAEELLADGRGVLVPFADPAALAREICGLLRDEPRRHGDAQDGVPAGPRDDLGARPPTSTWSRSSGPASAARTSRPSRWRCATLAEQQAELPDWRLDHLVRMTDSTGMFQHATYTIPNFAEGYCTDDNARALLLTVLLEELGQDGPVRPAARHDLRGVPPGGLRPRPAAVPQLHGLRPPLAGGGRLGGLPRAGPLGLGHLRRPVAAARPASPGPPRYFELALPAVLEMTSPRAWAFGLLGVQEYLRAARAATARQPARSATR